MPMETGYFFLFVYVCDNCCGGDCVVVDVFFVVVFVSTISCNKKRQENTIVTK